MPYAAFRQDGSHETPSYETENLGTMSDWFFPVQTYLKSAHAENETSPNLLFSLVFAKHSASLKIALLESCLHLIMSTVHLHHLSGSSQNLSAISQDPNVSLRGQVNGLEFHMFPSINTLRDEQYEWGSSARQRHCPSLLLSLQVVTWFDECPQPHLPQNTTECQK